MNNFLKITNLISHIHRYAALLSTPPPPPPPYFRSNGERFLLESSAGNRHHYPRSEMKSTIRWDTIQSRSLISHAGQRRLGVLSTVVFFCIISMPMSMLVIYAIRSLENLSRSISIFREEIWTETGCLWIRGEQCKWGI